MIVTKIINNLSVNDLENHFCEILDQIYCELFLENI